MVNADLDPGMRACGLRDDKLCKTGVELLPAEYTQEYTLSQNSI